MRIPSNAVFCTLFLAGSVTAFAAVPNSWPKPVAIHNGIESIELAPGVKGMAISASRQNFNAHDFEVVSLYAQTEVGLSIVPRFSAQGQERLEITVSGGADCVLHDFRLLSATKEHPMTLVVADRNAGESFADTETVRFSFYDLKHNADGEVGRPLWYFDSSRNLESKGGFKVHVQRNQ